MIVRCENCGTEFGFDDRQVGEGITVRCSVCKHVFKVESSTPPSQAWQIRTTEGTSFKAPDVATLREWIDEGRLHPDDQVTRTGRNWVRLGDMPEFARAFAGFQGVASVVSPVRAADPARVVPPAPPSTITTLPPMGAGPLPPQSQRPTVSPPRSFPPQANAPVAGQQQRPVSSPASAPARPVIPPPIHGPQIDDDEDALLVDDDEDETVTAISARSPGREENSARTPSARTPSGPARAPARTPSGPQARSAERSSPQRQPEPQPVASKQPEPAEEEAPAADELEAFEGEPIKRRGISPGLIAFLGVIAAVGVMFGVPSIRTKLLSLGQDRGADADAQAKAQRTPEIQAAELALEKLGTAALARAEADLQRAIDAGTADAPTLAAMKVALADLLLSRAIAYEIAAALDPAQREDFLRRAADDQEDGERLIDGLEGAPDVDRLAELRALARLAAGRPEAEVLPQVPGGAAETKLIVQAAVLWQHLDAPVPAGLVAGLTELPERSGLGESALALALVRAGDSVAARNTAERLLVGAEDQIVGLAVRSRVASSGEPTEANGETEGEVEPAEDSAGDPNVAKAPPRPGVPTGEADQGSSSGSNGGGGGGGGSSFDKLVERGCSQVRNGEASAGVKTLMRAFDMKDTNLDVLVCLAEGYAAQGQNGPAASFYDRALDQSPSNIPALRGAAKLAAKTGADERAKKLYERLLAADPNNAAAQAWLAKNGGGEQEAPPAEEPPQDTTPPG